MNRLRKSRGTNARIGGQKQVEKTEEKEAEQQPHDLFDSSLSSDEIGGNSRLMYSNALYCF